MVNLASMMQQGTSETPLQQIEEILETYSTSTDVIFSCSSGGRGMHIQAWDIKNGAVLRNYISDSTGEGSCICMAGEDYILCALKNKPFIFVWRIDKVNFMQNQQCLVVLKCDPLVKKMFYNHLGTSVHTHFLYRSCNSHGMSS